MKKLKGNKGITLIALVVTIVVLIILATVSISIVFSEDGIIKRAEQAKDMYANGLETEQDALDKLVEEYANIIEENESTISTWEYDQASQTVTNGTITLNIGDYVNYDPQEGATTASYTSEQANNGYGDQVFTLSEYTYGWRVLGVDENKQLLLIAEDFVPLTGGYTDSPSGRTFFYLGYGSDLNSALSAYENGVSELNNICAIYGQGKGAVGARCVNVNDINNITGYDPKTAEYNSGTINEYENEITYTLTGGVVNYVGTKYPTESTTSSYTTFSYYTGSEWKTLAEGESAELTQNFYLYYPNTLTDSSTADTEPGISTESIAYKMLFTNSSTGRYSVSSGTTSDFRYWLANTYVAASAGFAYYGMRNVFDGYTRCDAFLNSVDFVNYYYDGVRPVVTLASDVQLIDSGTDRDGCDLYNIK